MRINGISMIAGDRNRSVTENTAALALMLENDLLQVSFDVAMAIGFYPSLDFEAKPKT